MNTKDLHEHPIPLEPVPLVLDRKAQAHPETPWAALPVDPDDLTKGTYDISWKIAGNGINRAAWALAELVGAVKDSSFPTAAYVGPSDLRYYFVTVALMKLGFKVLLLQPNLSLEGQLNLLEKTDCVLICHASTARIEEILSARPSKHVVVPELNQLLTDGNVAVYPYNPRSGDSLLDPGLVIHTSGTTGLPRPVILPQGHQAVSALHIQGTPPLDGQPAGYSLFQDSRLYVGFPIAHAGGINFALFCSMCENIVLVLSPGGYLDGDTLASLINHAGVTTALTMPRVLLQAAKSESTLKALEKLKFLAWSGGPLPEDVGDAISRRTRLMSSWGTTESGMHVLHTVDPEDWAYNHFHPVYNTLEFRPCVDYPHQGDSTKKLYEAVAVANENLTLRQRQIVFWTYPHLQEWHSGDLWSRHPTKPNHWKYEGRADDMIILDSGHNFHPMDYVNNILLDDERVEAAHIVGNGRPHLSVILQLRPDVSEGKRQDEICDELWPLIQRVNQRSTQSAQINRNGIIIAKPHKPLPKTAKGEVRGKIVEAMYSEELGVVYA